MILRTKHVGAELQEFQAPLVAVQYNKYKGTVDVSNMIRAVIPTDYRSKRKQNRCALAEIEAFVYNNAAIIWKELQHLNGNDIPPHTGIRELRAELFSNWEKDYIMLSNTPKRPKRRTLSQVQSYSQPVNGHELQKLHNSNSKYQRKCVMCSKKTILLCGM